MTKTLKPDRTSVKFKAHTHVVVSVTGLPVEVDHVYSNESSNDGWFKGLQFNSVLVSVAAEKLKRRNIINLK